MPLGGWTSDELAQLFGLSHAKKASQAWNPAVSKVAFAMLADPLKTWQAIHEAMQLMCHKGGTTFAAEAWDRKFRELTDRRGESGLVLPDMRKK